ncbi:hypothetical protein V493_02795 [Pseudogymnoascus sp. VKM F-4281 (FW-2241)]|nr:hypothetical protein V493_02795 [Pseudogymnoascus sp. VKM F-4281 (FW-2241)]
MQLTFSTAILLCLSLATAASVPAAANPSKRQAIPHKINIGTYNDYWVAWTNGVDPCKKKNYIQGPTGGDLPSDQNPCNIRFTVPDTDFQYSMQGCGGEGLWIMRNGLDNVGECFWAPGNNACIAGRSFIGQWQCVLNDGNM